MNLTRSTKSLIVYASAPTLVLLTLFLMDLIMSPGRWNAWVAGGGGCGRLSDGSGSLYKSLTLSILLVPMVARGFLLENLLVAIW